MPRGRGGRSAASYAAEERELKYQREQKALEDLNLSFTKQRDKVREQIARRDPARSLAEDLRKRRETKTPAEISQSLYNQSFSGEPTAEDNPPTFLSSPGHHLFEPSAHNPNESLGLSSLRSPSPLKRKQFFMESPGLSPIKAVSLPSQFAGPSSSSKSKYSSGIATSSFSTPLKAKQEQSATVPTSSSSSGPPRSNNPGNLDSERIISAIKQYKEEKRTRKAEDLLEAIMMRQAELAASEKNIADPIVPGHDTSPSSSLASMSDINAAPEGPAHGQWNTSQQDNPQGAGGAGASSSDSGMYGGAGHGGGGGGGGGGEPPDTGMYGDKGKEEEGGGGGEGEGAPPASAPAVAAAPQAGAGAGGVGGGFGMQGEKARPSGENQEKMKPPVPNNPLGGGGEGPGQTPPVPNPNNQGQGEYIPPPYGDGSAFAEKAREGDSDRLDPITPATGSKQTPATANSIIGADPIYASAKKQKPDKVFGSAEERANMGKGAPSGYEFNGPYDFPSRPSGRPDTSLTAIGGWRSKTGEHTANLWKSTLTARGEPSKRDNYYKWSSKGGGSWKNLSARDSMRVFTKMEARRNGARWLAQPNPGQELTHLMGATLKRKMQDIKAGKKGNERMNKRKKGDDPKNNFQTQL